MDGYSLTSEIYTTDYLHIIQRYISVSSIYTDIYHLVYVIYITIYISREIFIATLLIEKEWNQL